MGGPDHTLNVEFAAEKREECDDETFVLLEGDNVVSIQASFADNDRLQGIELVTKKGKGKGVNEWHTVETVGKGKGKKGKLTQVQQVHAKGDGKGNRLQQFYNEEGKGKGNGKNASYVGNGGKATITQSPIL